MLCVFTYEISTADDGVVTWTIGTDGNPVAESILDEMYKLPEVVGNGLPGLVAQLGSVGLMIRSTGQGRVTEIGSDSAG